MEEIIKVTAKIEKKSKAWLWKIYKKQLNFFLKNTCEGVQY